MRNVQAVVKLSHHKVTLQQYEAVAIPVYYTLARALHRCDNSQWRARNNQFLRDLTTAVNKNGRAYPTENAKIPKFYLYNFAERACWRSNNAREVHV
jgi:Tfp pilus assembly protein PilV